MSAKRRDEVLVGLVLIVALLIGLGGTIWIARGGLSKGYPMHARFAWGAGLKQGQAVLLGGVQVGFVDEVHLIPDGTITVTMRIQKEHLIPNGTTASIKPNGIFGDQLIALEPELHASGYMSAGDTIPVGEGVAGMEELLGKGDTIATNIAALTGEAREQFVAEGGMREIRGTITELTKLVSQLGKIAAAQSDQLTKTQDQLRRTLAAVDSTRVDSSMAKVQAMTAGFEQLAGELRNTNQQVQRIMDRVENGNGTAGRLLNDPAVYARMDTLLSRIDSLVIDIKKNPRKYVNLRIF